jgi:PKD repeat protein
MKKIVLFLFLFAVTQLHAQTTITTSGSWCDGSFQIALSETEGVSEIQWYKDEVLLSGEDDPVLNCTNYGNGIYQVRYKLDGESFQLEEIIEDQTPTANFDAENLLAAAVTAFKDQSVADETIVAWSWDFGNGETSTEQHPKVMFKEQKTYTITLTVTTATGCTNTITKTHRWAYE